MSAVNSLREVQLELLRAGPAHNQLLSPLTPYVALCGAAGPATVQQPFEHLQLQTRLERLRYGTDKASIPASQREAELRELGEIMGRMLAQVPTLQTELSGASQAQARLVNLRLSVSPYELGLLPFEAAIGMEGMPGAGAPLLLGNLISLTREIRRGQPLQVEWNRKPRILFAFATPKGLAPVPALDHMKALRCAVQPWMKLRQTKEARALEARNFITVLEQASLEDIRKACCTSEYTHVHILAHGDTYKEAGVDRYGVALCADNDRTRADVVDGKRLANALKGWNSSGQPRKPPTLLSLATCDSGNVGDVVVPGGSIAHEVHAAGIPWVIASQFPLWMSASVRAVEVLYGGLLRGDDPRWVLHELRQRLHSEFPQTHDWASIVAYAAVAPDLEAQVLAFRNSQFRASTEVLFDRMDELATAALNPAPRALTPQERNELDQHSQTIRSLMSTWRAEPACQNDAAQRAERLGLSAASEKRIAIAYAMSGEAGKSDAAYRQSHDFYGQALRAEPVNHWLLTQYLSLSAVLASMAAMAAGKAASGGQLTPELKTWWAAARQISKWQLDNSDHSDQAQRAWALATMAELELLGCVYVDAGTFNQQETQQRLESHCRELARLLAPESFAMQSTLRQLRRYTSQWKHEERWQALAQRAIELLTSRTM